MDANFRFRAIKIRFRGFALRLVEATGQQPQIIDGGTQPKPAIFALSYACIARGTGSSKPPPSSRESSSGELSAPPSGNRRERARFRGAGRQVCFGS